MGTNYYWIEKAAPCSSCGRGYEDEELHIGKSSAGWCFALRVHPELGINNLEDWKERFQVEGSAIRDEYGSYLPPDELVANITQRKHPSGLWCGANPPADQRGPYWEYAPRCIHGSGTYDLCDYEFC